MLRGWWLWLMILAMLIIVLVLMVTMMMTIRRLTINKVAIAGSPDPPLPTTHHCEPTFLTYWLPHIVNCNSAMCYKQTAERKSKLCRHIRLLHSATTQSAWENDETMCCKQTAARRSTPRYCRYTCQHPNDKALLNHYELAFPNCWRAALTYGWFVCSDWYQAWPRRST